MMPRTLLLQAAVAVLALAAHEASAFTVNVVNRCEKTILVAKVEPTGITTETLTPGGKWSSSVPEGTPSVVFKSGMGAQATLAEFSAVKHAWYDISIIPTGPKSGPEYCPNLDACKQLTGGVGFNEPMQIAPRSSAGGRCVTLTCLADGCADGYQFPKDDTKTHVCDQGTDFDLTFCPGGKGGETPKPTPAPTPKPTEAPTPSPTPKPTETPAPSPTSEDRSIPDAASNSSSSSGETGVSKTLLGNPVSEVAGEADLSVAAGGNAAIGVAASATAAPEGSGVTTAGGSPASSTNEVSVQSSQASGGAGAGIYIVGILGAVAMVAASAIFAVRRKKAQLDALESKSPRPTTTVNAAACIMVTPNNNSHNVSVL